MLAVVQLVDPTGDVRLERSVVVVRIGEDVLGHGFPFSHEVVGVILPGRGRPKRVPPYLSPSRAFSITSGRAG